MKDIVLAIEDEGYSGQGRREYSLWVKGAVSPISHHTYVCTVTVVASIDDNPAIADHENMTTAIDTVAKRLAHVLRDTSVFR